MLENYLLLFWKTKLSKILWDILHYGWLHNQHLVVFLHWNLMVKVKWGYIWLILMGFVTVLGTTLPEIEANLPSNVTRRAIYNDVHLIWCWLTNHSALPRNFSRGFFFRKVAGNFLVYELTFYLGILFWPIKQGKPSLKVWKSLWFLEA